MALVLSLLVFNSFGRTSSCLLLFTLIFNLFCFLSNLSNSCSLSNLCSFFSFSFSGIFHDAISTNHSLLPILQKLLIILINFNYLYFLLILTTYILLLISTTGIFLLVYGSLSLGGMTLGVVLIKESSCHYV